MITQAWSPVSSERPEPAPTSLVCEVLRPRTVPPSLSASTQYWRAQSGISLPLDSSLPTPQELPVGHDEPLPQLPEGTPPPAGPPPIAVQTHPLLTAPPPPGSNDYGPFESRAHFEIADFLFRKAKMSGSNVDELTELWAAYSHTSPYADRRDLHASIDSIPHADIVWHAFTVTYTGPRPAEGEVPAWMEWEYTVWYGCPRAVLHAQLRNRDFVGEMDFTPKKVHQDNERVYGDFMTGDWAWRQADEISNDPNTHGSVFCPVILGSDKDTVSVATGQNEYYPLYMSHGLVHNTTRRAQLPWLPFSPFLKKYTLVQFPLADRKYANDLKFRKFRRQLFHTSLHTILRSLKPGMTAPEIVRYGDGYFRRTVYGLEPYITKYPKQCLLACVLQGWCAQCDASRVNLDGDADRRSHEVTEHLLDSMGLKDLWDDYGIVGDLLPFTTAFPRADIHEMIPPDLLHQIIKGAFKDHLVTWVEEYLVLTHGKTGAEAIMADIDRRIAAAPHFPGLRRFPEGRGFKQWTGDDSKALMKLYLAAIVGYVPTQMVQCLSAFLDFCYLVPRNVITTSTLHQIDDALARFHRDRVRLEGFSLPRQHSLETNQRLDKLAAARVDFLARGMLRGPLLPTIYEDDPWAGLGLDDDLYEDPRALAERHAVIDEDEDGGPVDNAEPLGCVVLAKRKVRGTPSHAQQLGDSMNIPQLPPLIRRFLYACFHDGHPPEDPETVSVFPAAVAIFHAPSDLCGAHGMKKERIRAVRSWRGGATRNDCVLTMNDTLPFQRGLDVARVLLLFSFKHSDVEPQMDDHGRRVISVIHLDCHTDTLDVFDVFYVTSMPTIMRMKIAY
ncbi:hypothetical protein C8Q76DRAFT_765250 [Earliella scabrosa]|nr:hypothetical protein C8Q76DRAFT_765250 [Earliella scabrosa]